MLTSQEGELLVRLARKAIETYLQSGKKIEAPEVPQKLKEKRGVFVTLTKNGDLRGCIGHPLPTMPLVDAVIDAAISSATRDPRFPNVVEEELSKLKIEVSVLTLPEKIEVETPRDYPKHVEIGKHGLIIELGINKGLLLPQVPVEWNWDAEEFLSHACMKAGLMPDCWLREDVKISRFEAQIFSEESPGGRVVERALLQEEQEKTYKKTRKPCSGANP
ncbi:MAG: TIGR00296 family protein [Hadesarchaea archaeon]|nr:TIGR00296 family protein [Hadesarchaea archaeon]